MHTFMPLPVFIELRVTANGFKADTASVSCLQYSLWLDQHNMEDSVKFIKGALNATASKLDQDASSQQLIEVMKSICST